jgi:hypothetical protein
MLLVVSDRDDHSPIKDQRSNHAHKKLASESNDLCYVLCPGPLHSLSIYYERLVYYYSKLLLATDIDSILVLILV